MQRFRRFQALQFPMAPLIGAKWSHAVEAFPSEQAGHIAAKMGVTVRTGRPKTTSDIGIYPGRLTNGSQFSPYGVCEAMIA